MSGEKEISRRGFLKTSGMAVVGGGVISGQPNLDAPSGRRGQEPRIQEYRTLGRTGFDVSDIGFGAGFFTNTNVLSVGLDMGINYIDTGEHYVNGQSESAVGEAMKGRDRASIFLTTKLNMSFGGGSSPEQIKERFGRCLERLQTDYVDCLMIHMTPRVEEVIHPGFHEAVAELKAQGRVRFVGISNHGTEHSVYGQVESAMEAVLGAAAEDGRFDVALFVYNFLQKEQGERIIQACQAKDMGVTLMKTNPVGVVARASESAAGRQVSEARAQTLREYQAWAEAGEAFKNQHGLTSATEVRDAAIKFVLSNPGVHSACPSINSFDELEAFVALSGQKLAEPENTLLAGYDNLLGRYYCRHACGICESACPRSVPVNTIARFGHYFDVQNREKHAIQEYAALPGPNADSCAECDGPCESACPFGVSARVLMDRAHRNLTLV